MNDEGARFKSIGGWLIRRRLADKFRQQEIAGRLGQDPFITLALTGIQDSETECFKKLLESAGELAIEPEASLPISDVGNLNITETIPEGRVTIDKLSQ